MSKISALLFKNLFLKVLKFDQNNICRLKFYYITEITLNSVSAAFKIQKKLAPKRPTLHFLWHKNVTYRFLAFIFQKFFNVVSQMQNDQ